MDSNQVSAFFNQTSGHCCLLKLSNLSDRVLKPVKRGEFNFYREIQEQELNEFLKFLPKFYGLCHLNEKNEIENENLPYNPPQILEKKDALKKAKSYSNWSYTNWIDTLCKKSELQKEGYYLQLEDLTSKLNKPCIIDLKIGFKAYNKDKLDKQTITYKNSSSGTMGFRFNGLKGYFIKTNEGFFRHKKWGMNLITSDDLLKGFMLFFFDGISLRKELIKLFLTKIDLLINCVKNVKTITFYSTSLLIYFDGLITDENFSISELTKQSDLKLIDFAHGIISKEEKGVDYNFLDGLENVKVIMKKLLEIDESQLKEISNF